MVLTDWDNAMDANLAAVIATEDAVILGRRSYTECPLGLGPLVSASSLMSAANS